MWLGDLDVLDLGEIGERFRAPNGLVVGVLKEGYLIVIQADQDPKRGIGAKSEPVGSRLGPRIINNGQHSAKDNERDGEIEKFFLNDAPPVEAGNATRYYSRQVRGRLLIRNQENSTMKWNIQRQVRKWDRSEIEEKYFKLCPEKMELIEGKLFWTDEDRLNMLAMLLENVGMDAAVKLGDASFWGEAIDERLKSSAG